MLAYYILGAANRILECFMALKKMNRITEYKRMVGSFVKCMWGKRNTENGENTKDQYVFSKSRYNFRFCYAKKEVFKYSIAFLS